MMDVVGTGEGSGQALADADGGGRSEARRALLEVGGEVAAVDGRGDGGDFGEPGFAARGAVDEERRPADFVRGRRGRRGRCGGCCADGVAVGGTGWAMGGGRKRKAGAQRPLPISTDCTNKNSMRRNAHGSYRTFSPC